MPERLLYSISTRGKMSFDNFETAFSTIYAIVHNYSQKECGITPNYRVLQQTFPEGVSFTHLKYQTLRFLDALGHCEFDFGKRYVYACPPVLALVPSFGLPKAVLTGARNPDLIKHIKAFASVNKDTVRFDSIPQKVRYSLLPPAIYLEAISKDLVEGVAVKAGISFKIEEPAAWRLINFSSGISNIKQNILFEDRAELNWPKRTFSITNLYFDKLYLLQDGLKLVEYTNPRDQQKLHWIWNDKMAAEIDRDWGRFLVLSSQNVNVILYNKKRFLFAVPTTVPLPRLISRALTLCTGLAPTDAILKGQPVKEIPVDCRFNVYQAVIPSIAEIVAKKLGQILVNYNLEVDESGEIQ